MGFGARIRDRATQRPLGLVEIAAQRIGEAHIRQNGRIVGRKRQRVVVVLQGLIVEPHLIQRDAESGVNGPVLRLEPCRLVQHRSGLIGPPARRQGLAVFGQHVGIRVVGDMGPLHHADGLRHRPDLPQGARIVDGGIGVIRIALV